MNFSENKKQLWLAINYVMYVSNLILRDGGLASYIDIVLYCISHERNFYWHSVI
jgi:hypothetical protein